jgi:hypothetical protein
MVIGIKQNIDACGFADGLVEDLDILRGMNGKRLGGKRLELGWTAEIQQLFALARSHGGFSRWRIGLSVDFGPGQPDFLAGQLVAGIDFERAQELCQRAGIVSLVTQALTMADVGG